MKIIGFIFLIITIYTYKFGRLKTNGQEEKRFIYRLIYSSAFSMTLMTIIGLPILGLIYLVQLL